MNLNSLQQYKVWSYKLSKTSENTYWNIQQKKHIEILYSSLSQDVFVEREMPKDLDVNQLQTIFEFYELEFLFNSLALNYNPSQSYSRDMLTLESPICPCGENSNGFIYKECSAEQQCKKSSDCDTAAFGCGAWWLQPCDGVCGKR